MQVNLSHVSKAADGLSRECSLSPLRAISFARSLGFFVLICFERRKRGDHVLDSRTGQSTAAVYQKTPDNLSIEKLLLTAQCDGVGTLALERELLEL